MDLKIEYFYISISFESLFTTKSHSNVEKFKQFYFLSTGNEKDGQFQFFIVEQINFKTRAVNNLITLTKKLEIRCFRNSYASL